ncbi:Protein CBR-TAG-342 [Caenorhabditis briggsae]|uniref:Uncharacterized protein n=3 Tax=Caenorhabditis briggsae TaxID=6238 RepID=A0AAE9EMD3_CAEBR|nr:Protein CBR-TAG-342 [Caenorhabditis briggsae]ULU02022.1 hypothetical protein L3Y34_001943 [Caenorhabditis briggsae]UMM24646.1 hypothetical protein L5515_004779 [Caenorhabditis briggsae]CAP29593.1 Protein CBR-TAG-342 [Caenorhabditis briggsae]
MPPKRSRKRTSDGPKLAVGASAQIEKLEGSNKMEPSIRNLVATLMFTSGDDENPLEENEDFVLDILKNELVMLLKDVVAVHSTKFPLVKLEHILPVLKDQRGIISRFIKYLQNRVEMARFMKKKTYSSNGTKEDVENDDDYDKNQVVEDEVDPIDDIGEIGGEEGEILKKKSKNVGTVTIEENLLEEVKQAFSIAGFNFKSFQNFVDEAHNEQVRALQIVMDDMTREEYNRYAEARRISFQDQSPIPYNFSSFEFSTSNKKRKGTVSNRQLLLSWLGNPPINGEPAHVFLAFLAKEIVSVIVGAALVERRKMSPAEGGLLHHCYYEEPFRKNKRFRKYGRFLF